MTSVLFNIDILLTGMPSPPAIVGTPGVSVPPGSAVRLICRSAGASKLTRLIWLQDGQIIDETFTIADGFVVNELEFKADYSSQISLQCLLEFPPMSLRLSEFTTLRVIG